MLIVLLIFHYNSKHNWALSIVDLDEGRDFLHLEWPQSSFLNKNNSFSLGRLFEFTTQESDLKQWTVIRLLIRFIRITFKQGVLWFKTGSKPNILG